MMYKYFEGCKTKNELRSRYVQLLKQFHPDNGGNEETCKAIIAEYEYLVNKLQDIEPETENVRKQTQKAPDQHPKSQGLPLTRKVSLI